MNNTNHLNRPILKLKINKTSDQNTDSYKNQIANSDKSNPSKQTNYNKSIETKTEPKFDNMAQKNNTGQIISESQKLKKKLLTEEEYEEILLYLQKHFPKAFPTDSAPLPLAVGIHDQILATPNFPFSKTKIRKFLKIYTRKRVYRKKIVMGNNRFNIDGTISAKILLAENS